jgi:hypothetical protein
MTTHRIRFDDGSTELIEAASVEYDYDESVFRFRDEEGQTITWVPSLNVRSVTGGKAPAAGQ